MKKVFVTILLAVTLVSYLTSCENDTAEDNIYEEQAIDNGEIKEDDI